MKRILLTLIVSLVFLTAGCVSFNGSYHKDTTPSADQGSINDLHQKSMEELVVINTGIVSADKVNVRAGGNRNYEVITRLKKDAEIKIVSTKFGWHEIVLPVESTGWISADYVSLNNRKLKLLERRMKAGNQSKKERPVVGVSTGNDVRIRARPLFNSSVLGYVNKGNKVSILSSKENWYEILLPQSCTGWISAKFVHIVPEKGEY